MLRLLAILLCSLFLASPGLAGSKPKKPKQPKMIVPKANKPGKGFSRSTTVVRRQETSQERWAAIRAFRKKNPCPSNGSNGGICPGYNLNYIKPLHQGGKRSPKNLRWEPIPDTGPATPQTPQP